MKNNEPLWTAEQINAKKGDTTYKKCGWCKFAGCGTYRYHGMISGSCDLITNIEVAWDSPCRLLNLGSADIQSLVEEHTNNIKINYENIRDSKIYIEELKQLKKKTANIPCLPVNRPYNYFNLNDRIIVYLLDYKKWFVGTVVDGYRHHEGCVSYMLDGMEKEQKGYSWGCGLSIPMTMLFNDYIFFKKNPDKLKIWMDDSCQRTYSGTKLNSEELVGSLLKTNLKK